MANPLHFCLRSLGEFTGMGPMILVGEALNRLLDITDADTEYQRQMATMDEREVSLSEQKKIAKRFRQAAQVSEKKHRETEAALSALVERLIKIAGEKM